MKTRSIRNRVPLIVACLLFWQAAFAQSQGKVVINEYMPWTSNGCGTTAEFVELLNFGPGPVNIGCYIITTGKYSVTIPANTIIQPGEYYVLAGQNFIPGNCANIDSTSTGVTADLNWTTCNCTNVPIPTTGDGMMTDGGPGNTPLVLLDPNLKVIDAIAKSLPAEAPVAVTSSSRGGTCTSKTFNLDTMNINYEVLGMSAGRGNSFARTTDGDCVWLKDPQQSGNASNNRSRVSDISYDFDMINATSCGDTISGSVSIYVKHSNYGVVFPMSYTISLDSNNNGLFELNDQYNTYYDSTAPFIEIDNLPVGHFKLTVASVKGCYLKSFEFTIIPCYPNALPVKLVYFKNNGIKYGNHQLEWQVNNAEYLQSVVLEKATGSGTFKTHKIFSGDMGRGDKIFAALVNQTAGNEFFRLKITPKNGKAFYSPVISTIPGSSYSINRIWPNPATDKVNLELTSTVAQKVSYSIYNTNGLTVANGSLQLSAGANLTSLPLSHLPAGVYQLQVMGFTGSNQPNSFRFVKH